MKADFKIGGIWGNCIFWFNEEEFEGDISEDSLFTVCGFKSYPSRVPKAGDTLLGEFEKSWIKFEFVEINRKLDPSDQFCGKVKPIEQQLKIGE